MRRVGFWFRVLALLIDLPIMILLLALCVVVLTAVANPRTSTRLTNTVLVSAVLIYTFTEVIFSGTPGKRLLRLKIGRNDGTPADAWRLFLRWSTKLLPLILLLMFIATNWNGFYFATGYTETLVCIGCLYAANDDKLSWHDKWAHTAVYHTRDLDVPMAQLVPPTQIAPPS